VPELEKLPEPFEKQTVMKTVAQPSKAKALYMTDHPFYLTCETFYLTYLREITDPVSGVPVSAVARHQSYAHGLL